MTTANLSVGIDTSKAKSGLVELKEWMSRDMAVAVAIDPTSIDKSIQGYLKQRTFKVSIDANYLSNEVTDRLEKQINDKLGKKARTIGFNEAAFTGSINEAIEANFGKRERRLQFNTSLLTGDIQSAVSAAFSQRHVVEIHAESLTNAVKAAVQAGMTGHSVGVTGAAGAASAPTGALQAAIVQSLNPALEEIGRAATLLAGTATRIAGGGGAPAQLRGGRASVRYSAKDEETGATTAYSAPIEDSAKALADIQAKNNAVKQGKQDLQDQLLMHQLTNLELREQLQLEQQIAASGRVGRLDPQTLLGLPSRDEMKSFGASIAAQIRDGVQTEAQRAASASAIGVETLLGLPSRDEMKSFGAQIAAQMRDGVKTEAQRASSASNIEATTLLGLPSRDEMKSFGASLAAQLRDGVKSEALRAASASNVDVQTLLGLPSRDATKAMSSQIAAQIRDGVKTEAQRAASASGVDAQTLLGLPSRAEMRTMGEQLAAQIREGAKEAQIEMARFYEDQKRQAAKQYTGQGASAFAAQQLGQKYGQGAATDFLGSKSGLLNVNLDDYAKQAKGATEANKSLAASSDLVTSSMLRLAAQFAVGGTLISGMKEVFKVGQDVEYQLKFVSLLSDGATVSIDKFNAAIKGTNSTPREAADAMRGLAQNGLSVTESLQALPTILNLATAGEMSFEQAALSATGVMASFNLQLSDMPHIADVFTKAASISNTSVKEMTESMKYASTIGELYHVTLEETAAGLATLAQHNIVGTAAGTAYTQMWSKLYGATGPAKQLLDALGVTLTTSNGELVNSTQALEKFHGALATLNDASKVSIYETVFGKRDSKSAATLLGDLDGLKDRLDIVTNHADGFADSMSRALNLETTTGRAKALMQSFEISATNAFNNSSNGVQNLLDHLNEITRSKGFVDALNTAVSAVVNLTRYMVDNGVTVAATLAIWKAGAVGLGLLQKAMELEAVGVDALQLAFAGLRREIAATWASATLGITIVVSLIAEYYALSDSTDAAAQASERYNQTLREQHDQSQTSLQTMKDQLALNEKIIAQQNQGASLSKARTEADREAAKVQVQSLDEEIKKHQALLDAENRKPTIDNKNPSNQFDQRVVDRESETVSNLTQKRNDLAAAAATKAALDNSNWIIQRADEIKTFNDRVQEAIANAPKLQKAIGGMQVSSNTEPQDRDAFEADMKKRTTALNAQLGTVPDLTGPKANLKSTTLDIKDLNEEMKKYIEFRKQLDDAKYNSKLFGDDVAAALAEQRDLQESRQLIDLKTASLAKLRAAYAAIPKNDATRGALNDATRGALNDAITKQQEQIKLDQQELDQKTKLAALKAQTANTQQSQGAAAQLADLSSQTQNLIKEANQRVSTKVTDTVDAASQNAQLQVEVEYRKAILGWMTQQVAAQNALDSLTADAKTEFDNDDGVELANTVALMKAEQKRLDGINQIIAALKGQETLDKTSAGNTAAVDQAYSESAEYGFKKFWKDYAEAGQTASQQVQDAMKVTTTSMSTFLNTFVTKGKLDFKSFGDSLAQEALQLLEKKEVSELLGMMFDGFGGNQQGSNPSGFNGTQNNPSAYVGGAASATSSSIFGGFGSWVTSIFSANGNVMTSDGPMRLNKYANGGVATSPQLSVFGEGKTPEAYVPLPDGRTIPVTMQGSNGSGGDNNVSISVSIASNGQSQVESDSSGQKAQQLGDALQNAITERLAKEKRPGGMLYS